MNQYMKLKLEWGISARDEKHRLLYTASDERLTIIQFRFHYDDH